uniref:type II toxin-antitoxin system RelE/ParE family toxin n=1 Tax=Mesorhizobium sp. LHD-90 TaxID=3071414 RepID=UPI0035A837D9
MSLHDPDVRRQQAEKYLFELDAVFQLIAQFPNMGRQYHGETRQFVHGSHIILYRRTRDGITVGRVFHGAQSHSND